MYASRALQCGLEVADAYADYYRWTVRPEYRELCLEASDNPPRVALPASLAGVAGEA